jgi:hypothetical protein
MVPRHYSVMVGHHVCTRSSDTVNNKALGGAQGYSCQTLPSPFISFFSDKVSAAVINHKVPDRENKILVVTQYLNLIL